MQELQKENTHSSFWAPHLGDPGSLRGTHASRKHVSMEAIAKGIRRRVRGSGR